MADKKPHELWAEAIRDVGLLFFVFGPLDTILKPLNDREPLDWPLAALIAFLGILLVQYGVELECHDERNNHPPVGGIRSGVRMVNVEGKEGEGGLPPQSR